MAVTVSQGSWAVVLLHALFGGFCPVAAKDFLTAFPSRATFHVCRGLTESVLNCIKRLVSI